MLAIIYFDYAYDFFNFLGEKTRVENKDRKFLKLPAFDNEEELKEWVEKKRKKLQKKFLRKSFLIEAM